MPSEHDSTIALMNTQQVWLLAQDLLKTKPVNILAWNGKGVTSLTLITQMRIYRLLMASEKDRVTFL